MIKKIEARERHFNDFGWLRTYWLFSFDTYHDPANMNFGALRVFNDDVVAPGSGFPMHGHHDMEIVTIVLDGQLTHEDSLGHRGAIGAGEVQRMTAGSGIMHSEFNRDNEPCHLYQIWIYPKERGLQPGYEQQRVGRGVNELKVVASGRGEAGALTLHAYAQVALGYLGAGASVSVEAGATRRIFVYVSKGELEIEGQRFRPGDQARITPQGAVKITGASETEFVLIDVAEK